LLQVNLPGLKTFSQAENTSLRGLPPQAGDNANHQQSAEERHKKSDA
jgi:hypothetical protein